MRAWRRERVRLWPAARRSALAAAACAWLAAGLLAAGAGWAGADALGLSALERATLDWRQQLRGPVRPDGRVVIVAWDGAAAAVGPNQGDRRALAAAVRRLAEARAAGAVLALPLHIRAHPSLATGLGPGDAALYEALRDRADLPIAFLLRPAGPVPGVRPPLPEFAAHGRSIALDPGLAGPGARALTVWAAARLGRSDPGTVRLSPYGPAATLPTVALGELIAGRVPVGALAGRIALIGPVAPDAGARLVAGPFGPLSELERAATLIDNALTGRGLRRLAWADAALAAALALAAAALARLLPPLPAPAALAALAAMGVQAALAALVAGSLALGLAPALLAAALCGLAGIVVRARAEGRLRLAHADRLTRWSPYVPPAVVQGAPQAVAALTAGRRQAATVLFADLRGFTGLSERLPPERTAALLRRVYGLIDAEVTRRGGTVTGFLGDGVMALFGLPEPRADDAVRALACARAIAERFAADPPAPGTPLAVALGLNTGPVLVAALGGRQFLQLTATGDTVNVAHRLQALAKAEGATLAAGGATVAAVSARPEGAALLAGLEARPAQALRGRQAPVAVWLWRRARVAVAG